MTKYMFKLVVYLAFSTTCTIVLATDPSPLKDICVAANDSKHRVYVNGKFCKNPKEVRAEDFYFRMEVPTAVDRLWGFNVSAASVDELYGLNTVGVSAARMDYAVKGLLPPHTNTNTAEIIMGYKGRVRVGFVTSDNRLFEKTLQKGDVFVIPKGLIHFQVNVGDTPAQTFHGWGTQDPGYNALPSSLFGSTPRVDSSVLAKSFQVSEKLVEYLQKKSWPSTPVVPTN